MPRNRVMMAAVALVVLGVLAALALGATAGGSSGDALTQLRRDVRVLAASAGQLGVQAEVYEAACASAPVQCGDGPTGHTFVPPAATNHNPVAIAVLVTRNGAPRAGLTSTAFNFSSAFVPAGGAGLTRCPAGGSGCASPGNLFQDGGDGVYLLWVHPQPAGANWKSGSYYSRITVTDPAGRKGSALVEVTVP
jgi:hypothetical protein